MDTKFPEIFSKLIKEKFRFDTVFAREWVMYEGLPETEADNRRKKVKLLKSGKQSPTDEDIIEFCDIFDCTPDYLLGFSETPHHETKDIQSILGLSAEASDKLLELNNSCYIEGFDNLLQMPEFKDILYNLSILSRDYEDHLTEKNEAAMCGRNESYKVTQYEINQLMAEIIANIKNNTEMEWYKFKKETGDIIWVKYTKEELTEWENQQAEAFDNAQTENGREE